MLLTEPVLQIQNPRNHSAGTLARLQQLLGSGVALRPDPKRVGCFEIEDHNQVFYIHAAQPSGNVTLLAVWDR